MTYILHRTGLFTKDYAMFTTMGDTVKVRTRKGKARTLVRAKARTLYADLRMRGYAKGPAR